MRRRTKPRFFESSTAFISPVSVEAETRGNRLSMARITSRPGVSDTAGFTNINGSHATLGAENPREVVMAQPLRIDELNEKLRASGRIDGSHAMQLRRLIYANGSVNHEAARLLLGLDRACSKKDPAFAQLYVEALTDYFVWQTEPKGYVSEDGAKLAIRQQP